MTRLNWSNLDHENHILRQLYGDPTRFGGKPLSNSVKADGAKIVFAVASAANGKLTPRQRDAFANVCEVLRVPRATIEQLRNADAKNVSVPTSIPGPFACIFVSEGIRAASAEPLTPKALQAIVNVAERCNVPATTTRALAGLVHIETAARNNRYQLLASPKKVQPLGSGQLVEEGAHARSFELGQDLGPMPLDLGMNVGRAILTVAAADGELTETELAHFVGIASSMGAPQDAIEAFVKFDPVGADLSEFLTPNVRPVARIILLDAIRVARSDGFAEKERAMAKRGARNLDIEDAWVDAMECQLLIEDQIREARVELLTNCP